MIASNFEKNYEECCVPSNVVSDKLVKLEGREFFLKLFLPPQCWFNMI